MGVDNPLCRWGIFLRFPTSSSSSTQSAARASAAQRGGSAAPCACSMALEHRPLQHALSSVRLESKYGVGHECRRRPQRATMSPAAAAAFHADGVTCVDCADISEDIVTVLIDWGGGVPVASMQRVVDSVQRQLGVLSCLCISIMPSELARLAALFKDTVTQLNLRLSSAQLVKGAGGALYATRVQPLQLLPLVDMARLDKLVISAPDANAHLTVEDVAALVALPTRLRKLRLERPLCPGADSDR